MNGAIVSLPSQIIHEWYGASPVKTQGMTSLTDTHTSSNGGGIVAASMAIAATRPVTNLTIRDVANLRTDDRAATMVYRHLLGNTLVPQLMAADTKCLAQASKVCDKHDVSYATTFQCGLAAHLKRHLSPARCPGIQQHYACIASSSSLFHIPSCHNAENEQCHGEISQSTEHV